MMGMISPTVVKMCVEKDFHFFINEIQELKINIKEFLQASEIILFIEAGYKKFLKKRG